MMFQQQQSVEENMSILTCASGEASANSSANRIETHEPPAKKKRNLPGNPDPEAEVIALSPKTLMATNRFICEICNKGFQRDQNLQLHRRGHNLPWNLKKRTSKEIRKKVYVCPETTCVHHEPSRALGDLTGIKKHFCRKHGEKTWKCDKCSKKYAVQSDWKAHFKTCGTREYKCDCGTLFSRRDSFITHRAFCDALAEENSRSNNNNILVPSPSPTPQQSNSLQTDQYFQLKKEHENFSFLNPENIPPWLGQQPTIDSSSSIFSPNENPNPRVGPTLPAAYQTAASPHMSATALLQKAAEMGATMMGTHHTHQQQQQQQHALVSAAGSAQLGNKAAPASPSGPGVSSSFLHHAIINSFSSSVGFDGTSFEDTFAAGNILTSNNDDHISITTTDDGGNDGFTRDFLSLRSLSHTDILTFAGMGNCMNSSQSHLPQNQSQKQWHG